MLNSMIEILPSTLFVVVNVTEYSGGNQNGVTLTEFVVICAPFNLIQPDVLVLNADSIFQTFPIGTVEGRFKELLLYTSSTTT
jgi:hypothetical protein